jgi:hypothetical protein
MAVGPPDLAALPFADNLLPAHFVQISTAVDLPLLLSISWISPVSI